MNEYLFKVSIDFTKDYFYTGDKSPVYAVAENKEKVIQYVKAHLKHGEIKSVSLLAERLGMNMYYGKPKGVNT